MPRPLESYLFCKIPAIEARRNIHLGANAAMKFSKDEDVVVFQMKLGYDPFKRRHRKRPEQLIKIGGDFQHAFDANFPV